MSFWNAELLLQLDDMRFVVDADGPKFLEKVLAEQAIHGSPKTPREFVHIHNVNRLGDPDAIGEREIGAEAESVTLHTGALIVAVEITYLELRIAVGSGADDGVIGAGIEQERGTVVVYAGVHKDHGLRGAEGNGDDIGFIRDRGWRQE